MRTLPTTMLHLLNPFVPLFSRRLWPHVQVLLRAPMHSTNGNGYKRAILYARVSTDEQARSGYSLAQQLEALREYAAGKGYEVLEEVSDPGQSGTSLERPGMDGVCDLEVRGVLRAIVCTPANTRWTIPNSKGVG
jgi:hypothetical protein